MKTLKDLILEYPEHQQKAVYDYIVKEFATKPLVDGDLIMKLPPKESNEQDP